MSYILDALKKSEQERQTKQTPGINSIHRQPIPSQKKSIPWLPVLTVLAVVNGAGVYFWLQQSRTELAIAPLNVAASKVEAPKTIAIEKAALSTKQSEHALTQIVPSPIATYPLVDFSDLPSDIKAEIPGLNFSTHLYGEDEDFRMVNINGIMIREGEDVTEMIQLTEITEQGVILVYKQYLFEVRVLTNWRSEMDLNN